MSTAKKTSRASKTKKKDAPPNMKVLEPRRGVEKISDDRLEGITGGSRGEVGISPGVSWAVDRS